MMKKKRQEKIFMPKKKKNEYEESIEDGDESNDEN
jgi:hypothetical protein